MVIAEDFYEVAGSSRGTEFEDILDDEFWAKVTEVRAILEPISTAIIHLEGDKGALSAVAPNFTDIINFYESSSLPNKEVALKAAKDRWNSFLKPAGALAYLLDPMNIKKYGRTSLVMEKADQFIRDCHDGQTAVLLIRSLWRYLNHLDGFNESAFDLADESRPAYVWWSEFRCDPKHAALKSLARSSLAHSCNFGNCQLVCIQIHSQSAPESVS